MEMPAWIKWIISLMIGFAIIFVGFRWAGWLLTVFFIVNCFVLMVVVLLQSGKAADLAGAFGGAGSQTAFGPRGAATVLRTDKAVEGGSSVLQSISKPAKKEASAPLPSAPAATPATTPPSSQPPATQTPPAGQDQQKKP